MFQTSDTRGMMLQFREDVGVDMSSGDCCCENNHAQNIAHPAPPGLKVRHGTCREHH